MELLSDMAHNRVRTCPARGLQGGKPTIKRSLFGGNRATGGRIFFNVKLTGVPSPVYRWKIRPKSSSTTFSPDKTAAMTTGVSLPGSQVGTSQFANPGRRDHTLTSLKDVPFSGL
jgi:hypothetical protein